MDPQSQPDKLILASASPYRHALLERLCIPFESHAPEADESPMTGESTLEQTERLALLKAERIAASFPAACVIGSDQLAEFAGTSVGKPGTEEMAVAQLMRFSGRRVDFHTSLAVVCRKSAFCQTATVTSEVHFRSLTEDEVRRYVALDRPVDCAGAFRSEAAGPMLLQSMVSDDPTAIIGLPLIVLSAMLRKAGFKLP